MKVGELIQELRLLVLEAPEALDAPIMFRYGDDLGTVHDPVNYVKLDRRGKDPYIYLES